MSNNKIILNGCIEKYKTENQLLVDDSELFELFALTQTTKKVECVSFENIINSIVDGGNDGGIDSIITIVDDEVCESVDDLAEVIFSNKTATKFLISQMKRENSFKELVLDKLITSCSILFDLDKNVDFLISRFNSDVVEKIIALREAWIKTSVNGGSIFLEFNYGCMAPEIEVSGIFKLKEMQLKEKTSNQFSGANVEFNCYSSEELLKLYQTKNQTRLSISFKDQPLLTSFGEGGIGFVGTVKLGAYKQFLTDIDGQIKDYLFESNVRHYQGNVDVNHKIETTIKNTNSKDFWWLNNGITIIAEKPNLAGKVLSIDNVQIVNGLQTSFSIFNSHDGSADDERSVLVKVIINSDNETIDNIIASTNSQNAVSPTVLRATDDTQRKIELFFLNEGYFYDRRKNYYKNQGKPNARIFSIQLAAQAIETVIFNNPHNARSKPTSLIKDEKTYERVFNKSTNFRAFLNCCLIIKKTNDYWGYLSEENKSVTANFKLHLARIAATKLVKKASYDSNDLINLEIGNYTKSVFDEAFNFLDNSIFNYHEQNPSVNLINIAKSKPFSEYLIANLLADNE